MVAGVGGQTGVVVLRPVAEVPKPVQEFVIIPAQPMVVRSVLAMTQIVKVVTHNPVPETAVGVNGDLGLNAPQNVLKVVREKRLDHEPVLTLVPLMGVPNVLGPQRIQNPVKQNAMRMALGLRPMAEHLRPMPKTAKHQMSF